MKTLALIATALTLSSVGIGPALANTAGTAAMPRPSVPYPFCSSRQGRPEQWNTDYLAEQLKLKRVEYDSITTTPGNCFEVGVVGYDGYVTNEIYDPASLTRIL